MAITRMVSTSACQATLRVQGVAPDADIAGASRRHQSRWPHFGGEGRVPPLLTTIRLGQFGRPQPGQRLGTTQPCQHAVHRRGANGHPGSLDRTDSSHQLCPARPPVPEDLRRAGHISSDRASEVVLHLGCAVAKPSLVQVGLPSSRQHCCDSRSAPGDV